MTATEPARGVVDSGYAGARLAAAAVALSAFGGVVSVVVALPTVQAEFGRAAKPRAYTLTMVGFALGGVMMAAWASFRHLRAGTDRHVCARARLRGGRIRRQPTQFSLRHGLLIAFAGSSAMFGPLIADTFVLVPAPARRRGGDLRQRQLPGRNHLAADRQHFVETVGRVRDAVGAAGCASAGPGPAGAPEARSPRQPAPLKRGRLALRQQRLGMSPATLQMFLIFAAIACCVAMSMPQVHIVAYCADLGYGARVAQNALR